MGFFRVKTYRKRLTGAVRSFLSYSKVNSGRSGEKQFFNFFRPLFGPISNHIGPNLTLSGTKSPNRMWAYVSRRLLCEPRRGVQCTTPFGSSDAIYLDMSICRPDIYGYLSTRYLWISGDQISMSICDISFCQKGKQLLFCWSLLLSFKSFQNHFWRFIIFFGH